jgi:asparagine synthase (glutamine-hydrolysing)
MPGIHLWAASGSENAKKTRIPAILRQALHSENYFIEDLIDQELLYIGSTRYAGYPVRSYDFDGLDIVFEGYVYNRTTAEVNDDLRALSKDLKAEKNPCLSVKQFVISHDGDYVCSLIDKDRRSLWLFNDAMGRLPIYYRVTNKDIAISREIKFIKGLFDDLGFDRLSIAEVLTLGYTLGGNTLIEGVQRLGPGCLVTVDLNNFGHRFERTYEFNFDELLDHSHERIEVYAEGLTERFLAACHYLKNTFIDYQHVVSLSGGFDSRAVLVGMLRTGVALSSFTYQDSGMRSNGTDAMTAQKVSRTLNVPWKLLARPELNMKDMEDLVWIKDGMNYSQMAFLLPIFRQIRSENKRVLHLSGDNGDRSLDPQVPIMGFSDHDDLKRFTLDFNTRADLGLIARALRIKSDHIVERVHARLDSYPETSPENKYRHFIKAERLFNWNFQAEDRNRTYFWHATPFSSFHCYKYALSIPDRYKYYRKLTEHFLKNIDPRSIVEPYAAWGAPITSPIRYVKEWEMALYGYVFRWARVISKRKYLKRRSGGSSKHSFIVELLDEAAPFFDVDGLRQLLDSSGDPMFHNVLTVLMYMRLTKRRFFGLG